MAKLLYIPKEVKDILAKKATAKKIRTAFCLACSLDKNGVKTHVSLDHTCGKETDNNAQHYYTPFPKNNCRGSYKLIYIAGKVTGLPYREVVLKFREAQALLEAAGDHAINPTLLCTEETPWPTAMRICIGALTTADAVYMLPCWQNSTGAKLEHELATKLGIQIIYAKP